MTSFRAFYVSQKQVSTFENDLNNGIKSFKKFLSLHPDLSCNEAFNLYLKEQSNLMLTLLARPSVRANSYRLLAVEDLLENKSEFQRIYSEILSEIKSGKLDIHDPKSIYYPLDLDTCKKSHLIDSFRIEENNRTELLGLLKETEESFKKKYTAKLIKQKCSHLPKSQFDSLLYLTQDHITRISSQIKDDRKELTDRVRPTLVSNLLDIYQKLSELGLIDDYITNQNKKIPGPIRIKKQDATEFFTEQNLNDLSTTELLALNAFYFNRLTKELKGLEALHFLSLTPGYNLEELINNDAPLDMISYLEKMNLTREFEFLNEMYDTNLADSYARIKPSIENKRSDDNASLVHHDKTPEELFKDYYPEYKRLTGKSYEEFLYKIKRIPALKNSTTNFYKQKQYTLLSALLYMSSSKKIQNWGIVPESNGTINLNKDYLLLGFDIPGFNMPLFIHTPKDTVIDFSRQCMKTEMFPIYEGANDFTINGKHLPTPLLIKAPKTLKESMASTMDRLKKNSFVNTYERLYEHIYYLANPKKASLPDHLRTPVKEKGKDKLKFIRKFVSLKNGSVISEKELKAQSQK